MAVKRVVIAVYVLEEDLPTVLESAETWFGENDAPLWRPGQPVVDDGDDTERAVAEAFHYELAEMDAEDEAALDGGD